mmetsp:Transcript_110490/g.319304  ORF Transcript_110490/g.319304 Transcript_110490/m.319304 type:complete len:214 (+) Transcript_110490:414-1055(+)
MNVSRVVRVATGSSELSVEITMTYSTGSSANEAMFSTREGCARNGDQENSADVGSAITLMPEPGCGTGGGTTKRNDLDVADHGPIRRLSPRRAWKTYVRPSSKPSSSRTRAEVTSGAAESTCIGSTSSHKSSSLCNVEVSRKRTWHLVTQLAVSIIDCSETVKRAPMHFGAPRPKAFNSAVGAAPLCSKAATIGPVGGPLRCFTELNNRKRAM